ncbi:MAG TPA: hypothetical protein VFU05_11220 [Cyclobacteriaceae bacterium]|nr:hypothetical protein [Cyclobacteriaceae bacterium]
MKDIIIFLTTLFLGYICFIGLVFFLGRLFFPVFGKGELKRKAIRWKKDRVSITTR